MSSPSNPSAKVRFGDYELDLTTSELRINGNKFLLQGQPFHILCMLLERPGELVSREELKKKLWTDGTFVDFDHSLNKAVNRLREALGDDAEHPRFIETLPRKGYRWIGTLEPFHQRPIESESPNLSSPHLTADRHDQTDFVAFAAEQTKSRVLLTIGTLLLLAAAALAGWLYHRRLTNPAPPSLQIESIAVLPLENLSGDASQEYLSDGITDEITTALARLSGTRVISRTSAMQYKETHKSVPEIARELNVGALVEGSFQRSGDQVRIRVNLIRGTTDQHLWADEYDRKVSDVFGLENDIARDIAEHIQLQVSGKPHQDLARTHPINPLAFQDYLQGRHYWALRDKQSLVKGVEYFKRAIEEDPNDARSYAGLAHCYLVLPFLTEMSPSDGFDQAKKATAMALTLDASLPEAHLANAEIIFYHDWNFSGAENEFRRTLDLNPNYSTAHMWYGELLSVVGRHEEAILEERVALRLDPLSAIVNHELAGMLRDAGRYDEAIRQYRETLKLNPKFYAAQAEVSVAFRRQGKILESIHELQAGAEGIVQQYKLNPAIIAAINNLEPAYKQSGRRGYLQQCLKVHSYQPRPSFYMARDYAQLGDRDAAFAQLTRSYQKHDPEALWLFTDPELDSLRADPRFQRLILAIGFPAQSQR
jgi:TolB-like protein/DNA-binding winged helix-turn-helix (wHTH) protein/tetratricopeptide (TPR) repeat protein